MASWHHFWLILLPCLAGIHFATQDDVCAPRSTVVNLKLTGTVLSWEKPEKEECEISFYDVRTSRSNGTQSRNYTVTETSVDLGNLDHCQTYSFTVRQVTADNRTSMATFIYVTTPPPPDADLQLDSVSFSQTGRDVKLQWSLEDQYISCVRNYWVVAHNEDDDSVQSVYTILKTAYINKLVPCARYTFAVRAFFHIIEDGPATVIRHTANAAVPATPNLGNVTMTTTTATFSWILEEYSKNRCPITSLIIDASPDFNVTYNIPDQANRTPLPLRLTGLTPNTMYNLQVTANSTAGPSKPFQISIQTLP